MLFRMHFSCLNISYLLDVHFQIDVNTEVRVIRHIGLKELRLYMDFGRCSRPLFNAEGQNCSWKGISEPCNKGSGIDKLLVST